MEGSWCFLASAGRALSLWRVASSGGTPERVAERLERASLSPSGDRAFGVLTRGSRYGVAVLPLAGGEPLWIPSDSVATGLSGIFQWAPDETGVYYTTAERANLLFYRFGTAAVTSLTRLTGDAILFNGAISRDGRTMLVTRGAQGRDVFLITMPR